MPAITDTLPKLKYWDRMVSEWFADEWDTGFDYFLGDVVTYNGMIYESIHDGHRDKQPSQSPDFWVQADAQLQHYNPDELKSISLIEYYEAGSSDTTWYPQLIGLDHNRAGRVINFYYDDVLAYFRSVSQPLLLDTGFDGHLEDGLFLPGDKEKMKLALWLQNSLNNRNIVVTPEQVKDHGLYLRFLNDTLIYANFASRWVLIQDPATLDVILRQADADYFGGPVVILVPATSILKVIDALNLRASKFLTYSEMLQTKHFSIHDRSRMDIDSLRGTKTRKIPPAKAGKSFFMERYLAKMDSSNNSLHTPLTAVAEIISKAVSEKKLKGLGYGLSFFDLQGGTEPIDPDLYPEEFTEILVTYKRYLAGPMNKTKSIEPYSIQFVFRARGEEEYINYWYLNWPEVKALLLPYKDKEVPAFIEVIEEGRLNYSYSWHEYGLVEAAK